MIKNYLILCLFIFSWKISVRICRNSWASFSGSWPSCSATAYNSGYSSEILLTVRVIACFLTKKGIRFMYS